MRDLVKQHWANSTLLHIACLVFLIFVIYGNTFNAPFQWDENEYLMKNPIIKDLNYFSHPSEAQGLKYYNFLILRYIGFLTFALNYSIHGCSVAGYHIVNIAIHLMNAILVYYLVSLTFRTPFMETSSIKGQAPSVALFSSLLFAAHPLQTMAVTYVFQRFTSLAALFYLLSLTMYIQSRLAEDKQRRILFYSIGLISTVMAMKTKENAFTLPLVIALYEFLFFRDTMKRRISFLVLLLLTLSIVPLTLWGLSGNSVPLPGSYGAGTFSREEYLLTQLRVIVAYLRLLFLPVNQNINYDYPVFKSFFDPQIVLSFVFLVALFVLGVYLLQERRGYKSSRKGISSIPFHPPDLRLVGFGIMWFFVTLSVESSIIPLDWLIDEYRLYLPSIGVSISVVTAAFLLKEKMNSLKAEKAIIVMLALAVGVLSIATHLRNELWVSKISLWEDTVKKSPMNAKTRYNLASAYQASNMPDKAIEQYLVVLKLRPNDEKAHYNLGVMYCKQGRDTECAYEINSSYAINHYGKGVSYTKRGFFEEAIQEFQTAIKLKPDFAEAHHNLGFTYGKLSMPDKAVEQYLIAIKLKPDMAEAHYNLGTLYYQAGQMDKAQQELTAVLQIKPDDQEAQQLLKAISR